MLKLQVNKKTKEKINSVKTLGGKNHKTLPKIKKRKIFVAIVV